MKRNLDARVEVMVPILDQNIKKVLKKILRFQLKDNVKARMWDADLSNAYKKQGKKTPFRSQYEIYRYFREKTENRKEKDGKKSKTKN
jgi:polyphosphate kinase